MKKRMSLFICFAVAVMSACGGSSEPETVGRQGGNGGNNNSTVTVSDMDIKISNGSSTISATIGGNTSAQAFAAKLKEGPVTIEMHDYGGFEKVGPLGFSIVQNNEDITTAPGDIILYQGSNICLYYDVNTYDFTRLGKMDKALSQSDIKSFLNAGGGNISVTFTLAE